MAELIWNPSSKTVFVKVDSSAGYGQDYEIIGSLGSEKTGTTSPGGLTTNTNWKPSYNNETLTLYINNAYKGEGCYTGSTINWGSSCSGSGGGGDSDCEDIYPVNLEGLSYVCSSSYWNIAADTSTEKAITITPIQWFESSQLMRLQVKVKMASSYSRQTGGRVTKITLTDSVGNTGTISFTASSGNQFINGNGTNIWSGTKDFYWPSGKTKTFSVTVAWATYSDYDYSSDGCIETWHMDNNGNGSKTGIVATYTGSIEGLEFYWKTSTNRPAKDKEIADYITAAKWNSLCNSDKVNLSSLANKTSGVSKIIGTEVRQILLALGGSSSTYPLASFQPNQPVLAKWFTDIEDLYNS